MDEEQSLDDITLAELKRRVNLQTPNQGADTATVRSIQAISSRNRPLVQLSDVVAGALNRRLNQNGEPNFKDEMAGMVIQMLDLQLEAEDVGGLDVSAMFKV